MLPRPRPALEKVLQDIPLLADLKASDIRPLALITDRRVFPKGAKAYAQGQPVQHLVVVLSGWVKLSRGGPGGGDAVIDIIPAGHAVGLHDLFGNGRHACSAVLVAESELLFIPVPHLLGLLDRKFCLATAFLREMAAQRNGIAEEIEGRTLQTAPQRLAGFLLHLLDTPGKGEATIAMPFDKTLIASRLGIKPETFSRALATLRKDLGLHVQGATVVIPDTAALAAYGGYPSPR